MQKYNHSKIEKKWQAFWAKHKTFQAKDFSKKPKKYVLVEFPYPSGEGLHMGHVRPYVAGDVYSRFWRLNGREVMYPLGWDAFGLPAENYAIKKGVHPKVSTARNIKNAKRQVMSWGTSFDWSREVNTTDPDYYKWTQWLFLQFYKAGLAYEATGMINWCPKDKTGLANEEVIDGKCERCGTTVEKKELRQWYLKITAYAEKLLEGLKNLPEWPEAVKLQQANWIGKSVGAEIDFEIRDQGEGDREQKPNFVLLHGFQGSPKANFFPWLKAELEKRGFTVSVPDLPNSKKPSEHEQVRYVLQHCKFDENTIMLGHSLGAVVAMKVLEKLESPIAGLVLAGGFISPNFKDHDRIFADKFNWKFDFKKIKKQAGAITILHDPNDYAIGEDQEVALSTNLNVPVQFCKTNDEHFCGKEEPSILDVLTPSLKVFTTRPDTIFGATYMVVAPEHGIIQSLKLKIQNWKEVQKYIEKAKQKSEIERTAAAEKEKTGVELKGVKAVNPATGQEVPVFVADYVLWGYGTGAIMAVPAHDERDFAFAKKFKLPIKHVVLKPDAKVRSYLMGADGVSNEELTRLGITVEKAADGDRMLVIPKEGLSAYENLIGDKMSPGFWNEYIGDATVFVFKHEDGKIERLELNFENAGRIHELAEKFSKSKFIDPWSMLAGNSWYKDMIVHSEYGTLINSGEFTGLKSGDAIPKMAEKFGKLTVQYKLRDWVFSRQRYWGEPIPIIHCQKCGVVPVPEKELPVKLPPVKKYEPTGTGESPLAAIKSWVNTKCPQCKGKAKRETNTMPQWAGSSWYFLRYTDPRDKKQFADKKKQKYWMPIDVYFGGMEHTTLHLLYSRFWNLFLYDQKLVTTKEPYSKRQPHGIILAADGEKMSKSRGNVVNPDDIVKKFGADTLRMYELFLGPHEMSVSWNDQGVLGIRRFLDRVWFWVNEVQSSKLKVKSDTEKVSRALNKLIKKVGEDIQGMRFNTAISAFMEFHNEVKQEPISLGSVKKFLILLYSFAPHLCEELNQMLGSKKTLQYEPWPQFDQTMVVDSMAQIVVQINGKVKGKVEVQAGSSEEQVKELALKLAPVMQVTASDSIKRVIFVKDRLINLVI